MDEQPKHPTQHHGHHDKDPEDTGGHAHPTYFAFAFPTSETDVRLPKPSTRDACLNYSARTSRVGTFEASG